MKYPVNPHQPATYTRQVKYTLLLSCILALSTPTWAANRIRPSQATGAVEVEWNGRGGPSATPKRAFAAISAFPEFFNNAPRGRFVYAVMNPDDTPHRIIIAELFQVTTLPVDGKAWMTGMVVSDEKFHYCTGGHDTDASHTDTTHTDGGPPDTTHTDDACGGSHETDSTTTEDPATDHDAGCSHTTETTDDTTDASHDEGCSHTTDETTDTSHDEGGCTDGHETDGETHDDGCSGSSGHDGATTRVSGKDSRVGQIIVAKIFDGASPGALYDHITWKWFAGPQNETDLAAWLAVDPSIEPKHLCKKAILGGNLSVHGSQ